MSNILIRIQAESQAIKHTLRKQESEVRSLASTLAPPQNTKISKQWIERHQHAWQTHLERIADFLLCGEGVWWQDNGDSIEFFDGPDEEECKPEGPPLHHFRTWNLKKRNSTRISVGRSASIKTRTPNKQCPSL